MFYILEMGQFGRVRLAWVYGFETEEEAREKIDNEFDVSTHIVVEGLGFN